MKHIFTTLIIAVLSCLCSTIANAQGSKLKVGEFNYRQLERIEDRVFFLYEMQEKGFTIEAGDIDGIVDIYASAKENRAVNDDDIDHYFEALEEINQDWQPFSALERKIERVAYYAMNSPHLPSSVYDKINADFRDGEPNENATCATALPFCTDHGEYHFYPGVDSGTPCSGSLWGCSDPYYCSSNVSHQHHGSSYSGIYTAPNPAFYYMRIADPGNLDIYMEGYTTEGDNLDIDFVCWGPFESLEDACNLSCSNMIDASYAPDNNEDCYIDNAQTGQYYMLLITNYGNKNGEFTFSNIGTGSTDCSIMEPGVTSNGPICVGETLELKATAYSGADSYLWVGPDGWTSTQQNPTRPNAQVGMAGTYTCTITKNGETAVSTLEVEILPLPIASFTTSAQVVCQGSEVVFTNNSTTSPTGGTLTSYLWDFGDGTTSTDQNTSHAYTSTGYYTVKLTVSNDVCDDYVTKTVIVEQTKTREETAEACNTFTWYGDEYTATGDYYHTVPATQGCDSLITLHLTITQATQTDFYETSCDSYTWHGITYTTSGNYSYSEGTSDCSDVEMLHLTIENSENTEETLTVCDSYLWNGTTYTESGTYTYESTTVQGCEHTEKLYLTVNHSDASQTNVTECDSYTWNGQTYTQSGTYTYDTQTASGCDSTATLILTINYSETTEETQTACDSYTWNGTTYTQSGTYTNVVTNAGGCTKTEILHLTVGHSEYPDETITACDNYTWNGTTYTASGNYTYETTSAEGCPRIETLNLTINKSDESLSEASACDNYTWNGVNYTESGIYEYHTHTTTGCDSIAKLNLTIQYSEYTSTDLVACDNYEWHDVEYTASGSYSYEESTSFGCPRHEVLNLTIIETPDVTIHGSTWPISGSETSYSSYDYTIVPNNSTTEFDSVTWQIDATGWYIIPYADPTSAELRIFSYYSDTLFPLIATAYNSCGSMTDTIWIHPSYYGTKENATCNISILPNPNKGSMDIVIENNDSDAEIKVYDIMGNIIDKIRIDRYVDTYHYDLTTRATGTYTFVITQGNAVTTKKVVIER